MEALSAAVTIEKMNDSEQIRELLTQIRDCHRESLEIQKEAVERQRRFMALYRVVLIVGGVLMGAILLVVGFATLAILSQLPKA